MNFFMNTGSVPLIFLISFIQFLFMLMILKFAIFNFKIKCCRRIGLRAEEDLNISGISLKIYYEGYVELFLASSLTMIALMGNVDSSSLIVWFMTPSDFINSLVAILSLVILAALPLWLFYASKKLKTAFYKDKFGFVFESFKVEYKAARQFIFFGLFKRSSCCIALLVLDDMP
jgi:hypothetical protein